LAGYCYRPVDDGHAQELYLPTATNLAFLAVDLQLEFLFNTDFREAFRSNARKGTYLQHKR
jgi:hypothetical protein